MDTDNQLGGIIAPGTQQHGEQCIVVCDADLNDIIPSFLERKREECEQLRDLVRTADFEKIRIIAHGMKGAGGSYGFPVITGIGGEMELAAKAGNAMEICAQVELLESYLTCVEVRYE